MSTLCSQADSCSLGAKRPALFSTLVVTEISLWTLTQPMCTCSCVWVCVHGCVCVYMCVLHCNSRGWSWKVFFFTWLPFFLLMTEAVGWWEESRPTVWNVGERQLCHKSLPTAPSPGGLPPLSHRPDPPPATILLSDLIVRCAGYHFHQDPPSTTTVRPLVATEQVDWMKSINIMERERQEADWLNITVSQVCFCISRTFRLHYCASFSLVTPVTVTKLYNQFNVNCGQVGESSQSFMCTNTTLIF